MTRFTLRNCSLGARFVFGALVLIAVGSCTPSPPVMSPVSSPVSSPRRSAEIDWIYSGNERRVPMVSTSLGSNQFYSIIDSGAPVVFGRELILRVIQEDPNPLFSVEGWGTTSPGFATATTFNEMLTERNIRGLLPPWSFCVGENHTVFDFRQGVMEEYLSDVPSSRLEHFPHRITEGAGRCMREHEDEIVDLRFFVSGRVDDVLVNLIVDTGSDSTVLFLPNLDSTSSLIENSRMTDATYCRMFGSCEAIYESDTLLSFGSMTQGATITIIDEVEEYECPAIIHGLLGMDILQNCILDAQGVSMEVFCAS